MDFTGMTFVLMAAVFGAGGYGASATDGEMSEARTWSASAFTVADPIFSAFYDGKPLRDEIGNWTVKTEEKQFTKDRAGRTIILTDPATHLEIRCAVVEYAGFPAVEWVLTLHNAGDKDTPILEGIRPMDWRIPWAEDGVTIHYSLGDSNDGKSFAPMTKTLSPSDSEPFVLAPTGGRSSEDYMPFFNIEGKGRGIVMAVGWSGQWETGFEYGGAPAMRVRSGMQTTHLRLHPGETIRTPRMLLVFWKGDDPLRSNNLLRQLLIAHYLPRRNGELVLAPICGSTGEVDPDGTYEGPHVRRMLPYAKRGIEVFWSDMDPQQWYPGGFPEGTGTWEPDLTKYPHGLKPIGEAAHAAGLQYLLWFEPERVAKGTFIAREHPDWVSGGKDGGLFKLHIPEARKWITDYIDKQVTEAQIDWMRWDFNTQPLKAWKKSDEKDRQGMTEIGHITGLYAMWDEYRQRHPGLVIDLCASGGRRNDLESLMRGLPLWHSDMPCLAKPKPEADQLQNAGLFRWIPLHGSGMFDLEPSYAFRSNMTTGNILCSINDKGMVGEGAPAPDDPVVCTVAIYKKVRPYLLGDFYPLFPHGDATNVWYANQFHRTDLDAGMVQVFRRENCTEDNTILHLKGLSPDKKYELNTEDDPKVRTMTGAELANCPITVPKAPSAVFVFYKALP